MATLPGSNPSSFTANQTIQQPMISSVRNTSPAVVAHDLVRTFGQKVAVNHLNLTVQRGEFFGYLGPNGAGKSTIIKMLTGLLRPTSGAAFVGGVYVWRDRMQARARMGVLLEHLK